MSEIEPTPEYLNDFFAARVQAGKPIKEEPQIFRAELAAEYVERFQHSWWEGDDAPGPFAVPPLEPEYLWVIPLWKPLRWFYYATEDKPWAYELTKPLWWARCVWLERRIWRLAADYGISEEKACRVLTAARIARHMKLPAEEPRFEHDGEHPQP